MAGLGVPPVLLSGDHAAVESWRRREAIRATLRKRPDLLAGARLDDERRRLLAQVAAEEGVGEGQLAELVSRGAAQDNNNLR